MTQPLDVSRPVQVGPNLVKPATWGVTHGSGWLGSQIRKAELEMSESNRFAKGDVSASWAGHCVVFVGEYDFGTRQKPDVAPAIVQAEYPKVVISKASAHSDYIWASRQPLTDAQRETGVSAAMSLIGVGYDWPSYAVFIAKALGLSVIANGIHPLFHDPDFMVICSGVVVLEQEAMKVNLGPLRTAATRSPDYVCPADCLRWGLDNSWMTWTPPA